MFLNWTTDIKGRENSQNNVYSRMPNRKLTLKSVGNYFILIPFSKK